MDEESLFHEARQKPVTERAAFLDQACGADQALRRRVEILLQAHDNPDSLLEPPGPAFGATVTEPRLAESPGTVVGPYKLLEQIGEGGFGIVYMADQQAPVRRRVALKIIKPGMDTKQVLARFKAELQALTLMDHPNIARALDAGSIDSGRPYFVMELVRGVPITDYCDQNNLPVHERLDLFVQVCHAVQHAHQKGIIHRDIKPSNVLVRVNDGRPVPKVIDFGVAKAIDRQVTQETVFTRFAEMIGTPLYMSPEQAEMSGLDIDTRADIYSLGVLLYELLTGSTPFDQSRLKQAAFDEIRRIIREEEPPTPSKRISTMGARRAVVAAHRHADANRLSQLIRGDLDWIVMKALEKDRTRRYATANALATDVERYLADETVQACPPSAMYRFRKFARRNKAGLATAALVLVALVAGTGVSTWQAIRAIEAGNEANRQRVLANDQRQLAQAGELTARRYLYAAQMKLAQDAWVQGRVARVLELLEGQRPRPGQKDLRGFGWYYLWRLCHSDRMTLYHRYTVGNVAISPDGKILASADEGGTIELWDAATGKEITDLRGRVHSLARLAFSPDGRLLAAGFEDGALTLWDMPSHLERITFAAHSGEVSSIAFSTDGRTWASSARDGTVKLWDIPSLAVRSTSENPAVSLLSPYGIPSPSPPRKPLATLRGDKGAVERVVFSRDGKVIATAATDRSIKLWDAVTYQERANLKGHTDAVSGLAFSPDGKLLASGSDDTTIRLWDLQSGQELAVLRGHADWVEDLTFSPDGSFLASASTDGTLRLWDIATRTERGTFKGHTDKIWSLAFAPDGRSLASASYDGTVKVWDAVLSPQSVSLSGHTGRNYCVAISPDGKLLASGSDDTTVRLWDVSTRQPLATLLGHTGRVFAAAFAPDGKTLATGSWDGTLKLWDVASRRLRTSLNVHFYIHSVAFSPDGRFLAAKCNDGSIRLWDSAGARILASIEGVGGLQTGVAFSPSGRLLASASADHTVRLWNLANVQHERSLGTHGGQVTSVAYSPDERFLASASADKTVKLWDLRTGRERVSLRGHTAAINAVAFSPDGKRVASASDDGTAMLWDAETGEELFTLKGHATNVKSLAYSPDGNLLATAAFDQTIKVWSLQTATEEEVLSHDRIAKPRPLLPDDEPGLLMKNQAWKLVTDPRPNHRDPARAIQLLTMAIRQMPHRGDYWNALGIALYRAGDWKAAQAALDQSISLRSGGDGVDGFFLAMAHWQLGNKAEARNRYDQAVACMEKNKPQDAELRGFRAEAEQLLGSNRTLLPKTHQKADKPKE